MIADHLVLLVALAGDQHAVTWLGSGQGGMNGFFAILLYFKTVEVCEALDNIAHDAIGIFATRVIVGDDRHVGTFFNRLAH